LLIIKSYQTVSLRKFTEKLDQLYASIFRGVKKSARDTQSDAYAAVVFDAFYLVFIYSCFFIASG
jgi:hypothetical protein